MFRQFIILNFLSFFILIGMLNGQTIVNTENLTSQTTKGFNLGMEINFDLEKGNADVMEIDGKSLIGYENDHQSIYLLTGVKYLSESNNEVISRKFIHLRHNYFFTRDIRSFSFYQLQRNNTLLLKRRQLFGGGLRKIFKLADSLSIDFGTGLMYEMETLNKRDTVNHEGSDKSAARLANVASIVYKLSGNLSLKDALYLQPDVTQLNDFRFLNELSLSVALKKYLLLSISTVWRYDSKPPLNLEKNDISIHTGIVFNFHQ